MVNSDKAENFKRWAKQKTDIHFREGESAIFFKKREIWWARIGVNIGYEQDGKNFQFERPVLVIKKFNNGQLLVAPTTSKLKTGCYFSRISILERLSTIITSQIRVISAKRLIRKVGTLDNNSFLEVIKKIKDYL